MNRSMNRIAAVLALALAAALVLTPSNARAGSSTARLTVSVTVLPSCALADGSSGVDFTCGGGAPVPTIVRSIGAGDSTLTTIIF
jgi:hypothetical protein